MAKRAEGDPPEAPKSPNPVCGKETMGNIMRQGMRRSQGGGKEGTCPRTEASSRVQREPEWQ